VYAHVRQRGAAPTSSSMGPCATPLGETKVTVTRPAARVGFSTSTKA
jgi:hypothetical protein